MRARALALLLAACFSKPPRPGAQADAAGDGSGASDAHADVPSGFNFVFVSSASYTLSALGGPAGANAACNALAQTHLPGTYVAWISTPSTYALDGLTNSRGWIRPDGLPFADSTMDITSGKIFYPPRIDETGQPVATGTLVATGTTEAGVDAAGADCGGFMDPSMPVTYGLADSGAIGWTKTNTQTCGTAMHIYCFGVGHEQALPPQSAVGPRAFVSLPMSITSAASTMDTECTTQANSHGVTGTFKPLIASTNESAMTHVGGTPAQPWVRLDGVPVTSDFSTFTAPLDLAIDRTYVQSNVVTGAMMPTISSPGGNENCQDWSGTGSFTDYGLSERAMYRAFYSGGGLACTSMQSVYCVQTGP